MSKILTFLEPSLFQSISPHQDFITAEKNENKLEYLQNYNQKSARKMSSCTGSTTLVSADTPRRDPEPLKIEPSSYTSFRTPIKEDAEFPDSIVKHEITDKFCMSKLCQSFVSKFQEGKDATFDTVSLMKEFRVKQRRVYDLMNIMEGCGCVKKISKKKYQWVGPGKSIFIETVSQKGDATSLRQITARIKLLISKEKGLVTFSKINQTLLRETLDKEVNPASIRRRIYQCCKVLRIVGFIDKVGKHYQWVFNTNEPRMDLPPSQQKKKYTRKSKGIVPEKQLIEEIVKRYSDDLDLEKFLMKVKDAHNFRAKVCKEQQPIYE